MSPSIGMGLQIAPLAERDAATPLGRVRQAIRRAEAQGIRIIRLPPACGCGVEAGADGWVRRPDCPQGVTPLGAILLVHQPDPEFHEGIPTSAAAMALNVSEPWCAGLEDGWGGAPTDRMAMGVHSATLYMAGYHAAARLFAERTVDCEICGHVRHRSETDCSGCLERPDRVR